MWFVARVLAGVITVVVLLPIFPVAASAAPMTRYSNCAALLKDYPNGVANNKRSAARAVAVGKRRPAVRPKIYRENASRLDRDRDGVACQQSARRR